MCFGMSMVGCAKSPYITLDEFLLMQEEMASAKKMPAEAKLPAARIDEYLGPYRIGPDDVLEVTLTGLDQPTTSSSYKTRVDGNGEIDLPLVGAVRVGGMEEAHVEDAIKAAYVPAVVLQLNVNVEVVSYDLTHVVVTGAAQAPGLVPLPRNQRNLLYAVVGAGGVSDEASGRVTLSRLRRPGEQLTFDLSDPLQLAALLEVDPLEDGDVLTVEPAMPNTVFIGGLVNVPGPQTFPAGVRLSMLQVLAAAGGLRTDVTPRVATLVRRMPDGSDVRVKLNLGRIRRGQDENIMLAAGDIFWVPDTVATRIQDFLNKNIFLRAGVSVNYSISGSEFLNENARQSVLGRTGLQQSFDPFGFLTQNTALQTLTTAPPVQP